MSLCGSQRPAAIARAIPDRSWRVGRDCKALRPQTGPRRRAAARRRSRPRDARRAEQARRIGGDRAVGRKAVGAAVERKARIVLAHFAARASRCRRSRRRADWTRRDRTGLRAPRRNRSRRNVRASPKPSGAALRARDAERIGDRCRSRCRCAFGSSRQQRQQDRARAGAEIGDAQRACARAIAIEQRERQLDDGFGFGPRHQHGRRDGERQAPEFLARR